jgi:hypothetical protein
MRNLDVAAGAATLFMLCGCLMATQAFGWHGAGTYALGSCRVGVEAVPFSDL